MRIVLAGLLAALATLAGTAASANGPSQVGPSYFVVRPDPRLCPSPLCGGYWVALANHGRTRCHDGLLRPQCYVARAVDEDGRPASVPGGALGRATIEPWAFEGVGELGVLVVARVLAPAGEAEPSGTFYRLRDTGLRCVRAPCFSLRAARLNGSSRLALSSVDLAPARTSRDELRRAEMALRTTNGLFARGRVTATADGGRVFRATRVYLGVTGS